MEDVLKEDEEKIWMWIRAKKTMQWVLGFERNLVEELHTQCRWEINILKSKKMTWMHQTWKGKTKMRRCEYYYRWLQEVE
jgi:hypothetical protein